MIDQSNPLPEHKDWGNNLRDIPGYPSQLEHRRKQGKTLIEGYTGEEEIAGDEGNETPEHPTFYKQPIYQGCKA